MSDFSSWASGPNTGYGGWQAPGSTVPTQFPPLPPPLLPPPPWLIPPLPPPPSLYGRRRRRRRWLVVLISMLVTIGIATPVLLLTLNDGAYPGQWDPRVAELADYVERERGLDFKHPVPVEFLTPDEYTEQTRMTETDLTDEAREELNDRAGFLRALGLTSGDVDLFESGNEMADAGTLAFYDPSTERVVVRGTEMTVNLKVTLVHELTHVLQDQRFDLDRLFGENDESNADGDQAAGYEALTALVEGDAMRIEFAYTRGLTAQELDDYTSTYSEQLAESEASLAEIPSALVAFQTAPYVLGQPLVELIAADGGNAAVDRAFADPPSSGEHIFDPRSYLAGQMPTPVDRPELPDGVSEETDHGAIGAVDLYLILAERIDPLTALEAADGWGNGLHVAYQRDGRACVRLAADGDTDVDDQQLRAAFGTWVAATPPEAGASVTDLGAGQTLVESCDPGSEVDATNERALDVLTVPAVRSQIALLGVTGETGVDEAWSAGDCFVRQLTLDQLVAANESSDVAPELQQDIAAAFTTCGL